MMTFDNWKLRTTVGDNVVPVVLLVLLAFLIVSGDTLNAQADRADSAGITRCIGRVQSGRLEQDYADAYEIRVAEGDTLNLIIVRISGDLIPFAALRSATNKGNYKFRRDADEAQENILQLTFPRDRETETLEPGQYEIVISRLDVEDGDTDGDFMIEITGVTVMSDPRCASDTLPRFDQPAHLLDTTTHTGGEVRGTISDSYYIHYYLVYLQPDQQLDVVMQRDSGDLDPFTAIVDAVAKPVARGAEVQTPAGDTTGQRLSHFVGQAQQDRLTRSVSFTASQPGWYAIVASRLDLEEGITQGSYHLSWEIHPVTD